MTAEAAVLFVCLGNICRSPTAQAVFTKMAEEASLGALDIDSAGTSGWHKGEPPDRRSREAGMERGYSFEGQMARKIDGADFARFDYILAMSAENLAEFEYKAPKNWGGHLGLFMDFADRPNTDVPDPYYGGAQGFETVLDMVEAASRGLIAHIQARQNEDSQPSSG